HNIATSRGHWNTNRRGADARGALFQQRDFNAAGGGHENGTGKAGPVSSYALALAAEEQLQNDTGGDRNQQVISGAAVADPLISARRLAQPLLPPVMDHDMPAAVDGEALAALVAAELVAVEPVDVRIA